MTLIRSVVYPFTTHMSLDSNTPNNQMRLTVLRRGYTCFMKPIIVLVFDGGFAGARR